MSFNFTSLKTKVPQVEAKKQPKALVCTHHQQSNEFLMVCLSTVYTVAQNEHALKSYTIV